MFSVALLWGLISVWDLEKSQWPSESRCCSPEPLCCWIADNSVFELVRSAQCDSGFLMSGGLVLCVGEVPPRHKEDTQDTGSAVSSQCLTRWKAEQHCGVFGTTTFHVWSEQQRQIGFKSPFPEDGGEIIREVYGCASRGLNFGTRTAGVVGKESDFALDFFCKWRCFFPFNNNFITHF